MPLLRGHHLICLHFFHGEGYDEAFIRNLRDTLSRAKEEGATVSSGADDICTSCLYLRQGRCRYAENADEAILKMDRKALALLRLSSGGKVEWNTIRNKIHKTFSEWFSLYCTECDWREACEKNPFFQQLSEKL